MVYSITYDLKSASGDDYLALENEIKAFGDWAHYLKSTWFVDCSLAIDLIFKRLHSKMKETDFLFVAPVVRPYTGWLPAAAWQWLDARVGQRAA
jgi:hypothetical protein